MAIPPGPTPLGPVGPAAPRARRVRLWPWVVVMLGGVAMAAAGIGLYVATAIVPLLDHTGRLTPHTFSLQLASGTYEVFEQSGSATVLQPGDVTVLAPGGGTVSTGAPSDVYTITSGGTQYQSEVEFVVHAAGRYLVQVTDPSSGGHVLVFVGPSLTTALTRGLGYLALVVVGGLVAVVGLILLVVRAVQRSRQRREARSSPGLRCANGHPAGPGDRFCPHCGAPVSAAVAR